ncbi:LacI family transcriptional regulator, partial [bacterium]|nr:LacI family transcriptional regulator [bacterium]
MATIKDIAKEAGVSLGTVSNMINKSAKVSKELSDRINKAIKKLKYIPNVHAKNLRLRTTKSFHIVLQDLD